MTRERPPTTIMTRTEAATFFGIDDDKLLTKEETAAKLRVTPRTLTDWQAEGRGPRAIRVGPRTTLYSASEVAEFLQSCRAPAPVQSQALRAAVEADRHRIVGIIASAPKGADSAVLAAISNGTTVEAFKATLDEAAAQAILAVHKLSTAI